VTEASTCRERLEGVGCGGVVNGALLLGEVWLAIGGDHGVLGSVGSVEWLRRSIFTQRLGNLLLGARRPLKVVVRIVHENTVAFFFALVCFLGIVFATDRSTRGFLLF
jgi:hypothetical protein